MQFNSPYILYALFALVIPVIIHFFQLRKFQKTAFTNVKFLQNIVIKTRQSSQLKKWLLLACRLLVFTCIIFAFSEPYFPSKQPKSEQQDIVIYIDNSFSNKEKGEKGELMKVAVQELIEHYPNNKLLSIITNDHIFKHKTLGELKNDLISLDYTSHQLEYKSIELLAKQITKNNTQLICISDFQDTNTLDSSYFSTNTDVKLIQHLPVSKQNISIDSVYFSPQHTDPHLNVIIKNQFNDLTNVPISIYNNDSLISKTTPKITQLHNSITFSLPQKDDLNLKIQLTDQNFIHDNVFYVSKAKPLQQHVLAIGTEADNAFLSKLFTKDEFIFTQFTSNQIDYNAIDKQHLVIINELVDVTEALSKTLATFTKNGGVVLFIPSEQGDINNYNRVCHVFQNQNKQQVRLTKIHNSHPIYTNVFEKNISNFQYPTFKSHYKLKQYHTTLLTLENENPFLVSKNNYYVFSAPLNSVNTNFKQAPLIVPTLYNIAKSSLKTNTPYYTIGSKNTIDIPIELKKDDIVSLQKGAFSVIPIQHISPNKVTLDTENSIHESGIYTILNNQTTTKLAFNYSTSEGIVNYHDIKKLESEHIQTSHSIANTITNLNSEVQVATLWKWFVIFAILFLLIELLILKYFK
ncbi:MAG: BatA domain-containing protein [Flavobacteriaceae bacterium]